MANPLNELSFSTISLSVLPQLKCIDIQIKTSYISNEFIEDLERLKKWLMLHLEVITIRFIPNESLLGFSVNEIKDLEYLNTWLQEVTYSFLDLPQTIIFHSGKEAYGPWLEFMAIADLRIAHPEGQFAFNHLTQGILPMAGGLNLLGCLMSFSVLKGFYMSSEILNPELLKRVGYFHYIGEESDQFALGALEQCPFTRIQFKHLSREILKNKWLGNIEAENNIGRSAFQNKLQTNNISREN